MAGYIFVGTLAAFGLFGVLWCLFGWLLPKTGGLMVCPYGTDAHFFARRYLWLRGMGLIRCPLVVVDRGLSTPERAWLEDHGIEICSPVALAARLGIGEKELDGTGIGDPPGCYQRRGIPEL